MKIKEGETVCISVKALYDKFWHLTFSRIISNFIRGYSNTKDVYYELYNDDGECACMDGEEVIIEQVGINLITFRNDNGESSVHFTLTVEEAEVAICR